MVGLLRQFKRTAYCLLPTILFQRRERESDMKKELGIFMLLVALCAIVSIKNPSFLSAANLQNTGRLIGAFGIFSLGLGLVIITGGIELSVGSMMALLGVLLSMMLTQWNYPVAVAVLGVVAISMA